MTWIAASGNVYMVCLLDTNAVSEISKWPAVYGRGFVERFPPGAYAPCFTAYSLVELRRRPDVYDKFLGFFSQYPCFLAKSHNDILDAELRANGPLSTGDILLSAFTPLGTRKSNDLRVFLDHTFSQPDLDRSEQQWRVKEREILGAWLRNSRNFETYKSAPNAADAERYVKLASFDTLVSIAPAWMKRHLENGTLPDITKLPSLQVMLYNQYYRLFNSKRPPTRQDVTDIRIMACSPYVDAVVTERYQADLFTKLRRRVHGLETIEIAKLRDIRWEAGDTAPCLPSSGKSSSNWARASPTTA